jgi:hypothetical protein
VPLPLPTGGHPKAAIPQLDHRILGRLARAAVAEAAVGACIAVPFAGGQGRDPTGNVGEVRLPQIAGAALEDMVPQVVEAVDHEPCCERDYSSAQQEAAARRLLVRKGVLRPEVQLLLHEGHLLALPYQSWVQWCPKQVDGCTNPSACDEGSVTKRTDQVGQLCCRSSHERRQWK